MSTTGLLLADDFLWISRITTTAQALGVTIKSAATVERLIDLAKGGSPGFVILDLGLRGAPAAEVISRVRAECSASPRFVAYGSHVDVATLKAAREAGCDPVLPRSKMAEDLEKLLREWAGIPTANQDSHPK
jgi:DNA-binding NarL/FixJ family response regulator